MQHLRGRRAGTGRASAGAQWVQKGKANPLQIDLVSKRSCAGHGPWSLGLRLQIVATPTRLVRRISSQREARILQDLFSCVGCSAETKERRIATSIYGGNPEYFFEAFNRLAKENHFLRKWTKAILVLLPKAGKNPTRSELSPKYVSIGHIPVLRTPTEGMAIKWAHRKQQLCGQLIRFRKRKVDGRGVNAGDEVARERNIPWIFRTKRVNPSDGTL